MQADHGYGLGMKAICFSSVAASCAALLLALPVQAQAQAQAQGPIGTVQQGSYVCELPGDAAGARGVEQEGAGFGIASASRYSSSTGSGTYLRRGDELVFTSGARNGERYQIVSSGFLRKLEDGKVSRLRCVRRER
jgi:hypothetical protein